MVHDPAAPLPTSTVMYPAAAFGAGAGGYSAPMWKEEDGDMTAGSSTFTNAVLVDATELTFIIVNKVIEYADEDYTFDSETGTITRVNQFQEGDKMITPHKAAEVVVLP